MLGGWDVGGIVNARSGVPVNVLVTRPDILYRDTATGLYSRVRRSAALRSSTRPAAARRATCGVRTSCPAWIPFIKDGGLLYLNPAAFAAPLPGTFGNMERNSIHGPSFKQVDFFFAKHFRLGGRSESSSAARSSTCSTP